MLKAFGRSTSGIHARPRKMVRFCCSVKPSQLWWGLPHPHHQLDFPHHPSKTTNTLASLVKGRWIDGKAQTVALLRFNCISTPFLSPNLFAVKTEGLLHPLAPHQPFQTRTIPPAFRVTSSTAPLTAKIKSAPVFTGANSSSH